MHNRFDLFEISLCKIHYYPEHSYSKNLIKVELELSNYGTKYDAKEATCVDKILKSEVDKLGIDESENIPTYLSKLSGIDT